VIAVLLPLFVIALFAFIWFRVDQGWRTRVFNWVGGAATAAFTLLQIVLPALDGVTFNNVLPATAAALAALLIQIGNSILREVTTTPPGKAQ
jgi:hypothetical protein